MRLTLRFATRLWYYFRIGYSTYLTFLMGYVSTLVTVYYLAIKNLPTLLDIFPRFVPFAVLATIIGGPMSVLLGWTHYKRSPAYSSEVDISTEANPYNYKLPPGYNREVWAPMMLQILHMQGRLLEAQGLLETEEKSLIEDLERKIRSLIAGGSFGKPTRTRLKDG